MKKKSIAKRFEPVYFFCIILLFALGCSKSNSDNNNSAIILPPVSNLILGADLSWLTEMESAGKKFYNSSGTETECMALLKSSGMNTIRLRVWVNPSPGWNNTADVVTKAVRAKNLGLRIMIDFHYSDTWADPGNQTKPAAWVGQDINALKTSLATHTTAVLTALKNNNVSPEWVQVGNETSDGMLWPEGKASVNMSNFAQLVNAGYDAVKTVFPSAKVIVHISNGYDNSLFRWIFDGLTSNGARFDVIGMSLYPTVVNWSSYNTQCLANMNDMVSRYNKEVMMVETGMPWDSPDACNSFLKDLISKMKTVQSGKGLGVLYWEPEAYNGWKGYTLGAFDGSGKPTIALNAFQ